MLSAAQLAGLAITPPADSNDTINLSVSVDFTVPDTDGAVVTLTDPTGIEIAVTGVADTPTVGANAASGDENTAIPLDVQAALADTDGSETLSITLTGIPAGASLASDQGPIQITDGSATLTAAELTGLKITPAVDDSTNFTLTVTAVATENDGAIATKAVQLPVTVIDTAPHHPSGTATRRRFRVQRIGRTRLRRSWCWMPGSRDRPRTKPGPCRRMHPAVS